MSFPNYFLNCVHCRNCNNPVTISENSKPANTTIFLTHHEDSITNDFLYLAENWIFFLKIQGNNIHITHMCTFFSPYFIFVRKISSIQDQILFPFNTNAVIQSLHLKNVKKYAPKWSFIHVTFNQGTGISWIQSNPVKLLFLPSTLNLDIWLQKDF